MQIVGVVKDSHHLGVKEEPAPFVYIPYMQEKNVGELTFYLRTSQEPAALVAAVRKVVADLDPSLPIGSVRSFDEQINRQLANDWLIAALAEIFAALAALLAAIGIYGLLAYAVNQRTRDIGIRMALGARPVQVGRMILSDVARLVGIGISFGLPLAYLSGRLISSMLYGVKPFDVSGVVLALFALVMVAAVAGYFPVRRATRVDPMVALRYE
jgi:predicted lysophospholipase L1 biosynthesis ABC-type transport system permease subunit